MASLSLLLRFRPCASVVGIVGIVLLATGCANLTEPPSPEPLAPAAPIASIAAARPAPTPAGDSNKPAPTAVAAMPSPTAAPAGSDKVAIVDLAVGKGAAAKSGDTVSVQYAGSLMDGTEFDNSRKHGKPFDFTLDKGGVIKGWDQGVAGMKVGGHRKLTIPPSLGYGARGNGRIPPNATLQFDIELVAIKP